MRQKFRTFPFGIDVYGIHFIPAYDIWTCSWLWQGGGEEGGGEEGGGEEGGGQPNIWYVFYANNPITVKYDLWLWQAIGPS